MAAGSTAAVDILGPHADDVAWPQDFALAVTLVIEFAGFDPCDFGEIVSVGGESTAARQAMAGDMQAPATRFFLRPRQKHRRRGHGFWLRTHTD